jgi:hypothetical protein
MTQQDTRTQRDDSTQQDAGARQDTDGEILPAGRVYTRGPVRVDELAVGDVIAIEWMRTTARSPRSSFTSPVSPRTRTGATWCSPTASR